jgi:hypothetical protein
MDWIQNNSKWLFDGIGAGVVLALIGWILKPWWKEIEKVSNVSNVGAGFVVTGNNNNINSNIPSEKLNNAADIDRLKDITYILFIDDDSKFKVVSILQKAGWKNTKAKKDLVSLDEVDVKKANILFVDIQNVGIKLKFQDQGLGLANALMDKYPEKKLVIYSAQTEGNRFHAALKRAHGCLAKNADPYQFQNYAENLSREIFKKT